MSGSIINKYNYFTMSNSQTNFSKQQKQMMHQLALLVHQLTLFYYTR